MGFLKKLFGDRSENEMDATEIYFHEDLYCQVEIIPRENSVNLDLENDKINEFSEEHFDGVGYTDVYARDGHGIKTCERGIQVDELDELITNIGFEKKNEIYTGYGAYKVKCKKTIGYHLDGAIIYCDFDENQLIQNIWIDGFRFNGKSTFKPQMIQALNELGKRWNLILNDWDLCEKIDLEVENEISSYIDEE